MDDDYVKGVRLALAMIAPSQTAAAKALNVSVQTIGRWRIGVAEPSPNNLARLARRSGLTEDQIRSGRIEEMTV
ncbi:helix-turn-helix transcriptional regulator [Pseudonocardia sp. ICBG1122]|nr:helix-turn-helix transcriptional regulator [Pseudonocardia pini]